MLANTRPLPAGEEPTLATPPRKVQLFIATLRDAVVLILLKFLRLVPSVENLDRSGAGMSRC